MEGRETVFCYECHEIVLHNVVFLPFDVERLAELAKRRGCNEDEKPPGYEKLAERIKLLHEVIEAGLASLISK